MYVIVNDCFVEYLVAFDDKNIKDSEWSDGWTGSSEIAMEDGDPVPLLFDTEEEAEKALALIQADTLRDLMAEREDEKEEYESEEEFVAVCKDDCEEDHCVLETKRVTIYRLLE